VALITLMTPPMALVIGWLFAGEKLGLGVLTGGVVVMLALALYQWGDQLRRSAKA